MAPFALVTIHNLTFHVLHPISFVIITLHQHRPHSSCFTVFSFYQIDYNHFNLLTATERIEFKLAMQLVCLLFQIDSFPFCTHTHDLAGDLAKLNHHNWLPFWSFSSGPCLFPLPASLPASLFLPLSFPPLFTFHSIMIRIDSRSISSFRSLFSISCHFN